MAARSSLLKRAFSVAFQIRCYSAPAERSIPVAKQKYVPTSGTYPKGFLAGSAYAGVKESNKSYDDIALVVSEKPCPAAAVTTKNIFKAAPVHFCRKALKSSNEGYQGVVVNSGCANAVTGELGFQHAAMMAEAADKCFHQDTQTLVMSTGVIGQRLPIDKITNAIPKAYQALGSTHDHWLNAAKAICTTDTFPKLLSRSFTLPGSQHEGKEYRIAGMTKGAGMIHPNMGTLLGIVCTDAKIEAASMYSLLQSATERSFNCISIDGDTSTNDTVAFFANGAAASDDTPPLQNSDDYREDTAAFVKVFHTFMCDLAKLVVRDGEGATKFVTINVTSDVSMATAKRAATSIARSALVKTALYGKDANWGRILCAIGYAPGIMDSLEVPSESPDHTQSAPPQISPDRTSLSFIPSDGSEELKLLVRGEPETVDEARAKAILEMEDLEIVVKLDDDGVDSGLTGTSDRASKRHKVTVWTCDLSHEYVTINGDYRT
ncbi:hypothetical protein BAUCODRAFT_106769 [Baudoinia panamericana UAMH 10762]|uniref:Arginine biosynthesis bifunctional protein ArgJ, mitochondrial n=1 Tax=Baudoinia panamericana (strain UAMH 10762) TaxID=717646 RepID=M2MKZ3_BAUPA|nr:uncharacterized protein BAUCODRAFT_106769 [Baudoinia panamericana UAMH 10762]EMC97361.1 hypothetical protein BAUCODRAFT_106769 [Baudoinia panamericana UAMH 10762]